MSEALVKYYIDQAKTGQSGLQGITRQKGQNIFGRALKFIFPVLKFIGKHALNTGINVATDVLENKKGFKEAAKSQIKEGFRGAALEGVNIAKKFQEKLQSGKGIKRKRKATKNSKKANKCVKRRKAKRKTPKFEDIFS